MDKSEKNRLLKLNGILGSAYEGERANAAAMMRKWPRSQEADAQRADCAGLRAEASSAYSSQNPPPPPPEPDPEPFTDIHQANDLLRMLQRIADRPDIAERVLTAWEIQFSTDVAGRYERDYELSDKQLNVVQRILTKASRVFK